MTTYYVTIVLVALFCSFAVYYDYKIEQFNSLKQYNHPKMTLVFYILAVSVLIFVAGFRYYVGADYGNYFNSTENKDDVFFDKILDLDEPGYYFICWLVVLFKGNGAVVIFVCAAITIFLFLRTIYKNTNCLFLSTLLFIFLGCWHGSFNGVRQYLAAAIIFSGIRFIKERKFWKYALVVFIAFLFHSSALLMIFIYFIAYNKINLKNITLLVVGSLIILYSFTEVLNFAGFLLKQEFIESDYITRSVNTFRILVAIAPAVFFLFLYQKRSITKEQLFWINMLIINGVMMFATSNSAYLARMGIYTAPFSAIGISELVKGAHSKDKNLITLSIVLAFFVFWWYEVSKANTLNNFQFVFDRI